jgi:hypothetical protein
MNERIDQLMVKAGAYFGGDGVVYDNFDPKKFAELIVKKCMDVAKYHTPDTEECEYTWLVHDKIKKHFGVEE